MSSSILEQWSGSFTKPAGLSLDITTFATLLQLQGPSLGFWRAAEVAALREQVYESPILEVGCGDGLVMSQVLNQVAIGVDPDPVALKQAATRGVYDQLLALPVQQAAIADRSIRTVVSNSVFEHLTDLDQVLETLARVMQPGGRLIFTVPTAAFSQWLALPGQRYAAWRNQHWHHLNLWTVDRWATCLHQAGFTLETTRFYLKRPYVALWDWLELVQQIRLGDRRLFGLLWRQLPPGWVEALAVQLSQVDLSAPAPAGGCLFVARRRED